MKKVIIGTTALKHWFPEYNREPKDIDYAVDRENIRTTVITEQGREERLYNPIITAIEEGKYLRPEYLLTLKMSHLFWDINWEKHMFHVQFLMKKGVGYDKQLFYKLYDFWKGYHPRVRRSDLKMSAKDFFNNAINYDIDHDYIHTLINPEPIYKKTLKDGAEVETDEDKFYDLSYEDKLGIVREEVMVMAWERFRKAGYRRAYELMLKKFIIGHAPLYMALFIMENYVTLLKPEYDFIKLIDNKLEEK